MKELDSKRAYLFRNMFCSGNCEVSTEQDQVNSDKRFEFHLHREAQRVYIYTT